MPDYFGKTILEALNIKAFEMQTDQDLPLQDISKARGKEVYKFQHTEQHEKLQISIS